MKERYKIVSGASTPETPDRRELADWLAKDGQLLIPLVELLEKGERAIDEVIDVMGRATIEAVLRMSAEQVAGPKEQGRRDADRELYWHGVQAGGLRQAALRRPRTDPRLPRPLHPPHRHQQPAPAQPRRRLGALSLHRLPHQRAPLATRP